jgi:hypothetical protein
VVAASIPRYLSHPPNVLRSSSLINSCTTSLRLLQCLFFGTTSLEGLNVVLAAHSPGHMLQTKWKVALYLDERDTPEQRDALTKVFAGQAGGHLANLAP